MNRVTNEETGLIRVSPAAIYEFWDHFKKNIYEHPASSSHHPVGFAGDDARYTLSGMKVIVCLVSSVLAETTRRLLSVSRVFFSPPLVPLLLPFLVAGKVVPIICIWYEILTLKAHAFNMFRRRSQNRGI